MRKVVEFKLNTERMGEKIVRCYEVSPEVILEEINQKVNDSVSDEKSFSVQEGLDLIKYCCNLTVDDFKKLYPSEKSLVFEKFKEANADFFRIYPKVKEGLARLGVVGFLADLVKELKLMDVLKAYIIKIWNESFLKDSASLQKTDTTDLGSTDGDSSKEL